MRYRLRTLLIVACIIVLFIWPPLYVLSVGPFVYLQTSGRISYDPHSPLARAYGPLHSAQRHCPPLRRMVNWYSSLWNVSPTANPRVPSE